MIKNILFELDDTLLDFKRSEAQAVTEALESMGVCVTEYTFSRYSEYNLSQWKRLEKGEITRQEVKLNRYRLLFNELGLDLSPRQATQLYEKKLASSFYFVAGARELLERMSADYDLYLVSNGTKKVQDSRLALSGISKYFKQIFISEDVGSDKPSRDFFDFCFSKITAFKKDETVIVGDSLTSDILGGINAGIKTAWFNPGHIKNNTKIIPDYEFDSLDKIRF